MEKVHIFLDKDGFVDGFIRGGTEENPNCIGYLLPKDHPFFKQFDCYRIVDGVLIRDESKILEFERKRKIHFLKEKCSKIITEGFEYMGYKFGFTTSDQSNITSTMMAMQMGILNEIEWTVRTLEGETARVILNADQFKEMCQIALKHKDDCIKYLRNDLEKRINECTTLEELNKISWEDEQ